MPQIERQAFINKLQALVPAECILSDKAELLPYECDGLSAYRQTPWLVALPENTDQVQAIVRCCHKSGVAIVARGAGTGLSGGALPLSDGLLLSLAKLKDIVSIDPENRLATVQPGVRNLAITEAASKYGLYYAPDPSSQIACSIGGNVAENAGGVHCLKYGLTVHNIARIKIITIDGDILTIGSCGYDSPGYDLLALLTGSEGLLGIITEITVRLLATPEFAQVILASFSTVEAAGDAVAAIISSGIIPAGLEIMDHLAIQAAEDFIHAGYPTDAAGLLLCEIDGAKTEVRDQMEKVQDILQKAGATKLSIAKNETERQRFWAGRKAAFPAVGRLSPDYYCMDGTIPRKHLGQVLTKIGQWSKHYDLRVANVFHAGDGNLHPLILYDANIPGELEKTEEFGGKILELCISVGGTITGEHGVGIEKINQMCSQFNEAELQLFHAIKAAFDPEGLLNPGKAIPTLARCAEFGQMHVHHGELPFPELERF